MGEEGKWEWIGESGEATQFWQGTNSGSAVGGLYNNWGSSSFAGEPDNYLGNQNALGFALTDWPYGSAGQWNDLNAENLLYFIIEAEIDTSSGNGGDGGDGGSDTTVAVTNYNIQSSLIYPNPSSSYFKIMRDDIKEITIINALGQEVYHKLAHSKTVNINQLREGIYFVKMTTNENQLLINTLKVVR
jgi:hypothetical protein